MNELDTAILQRILQTDPESLTPYDIKFLNARRGYLNKEQRRIYASVLIDEDNPQILDENGNYTGEKVEAKKEEPVASVVPTRKELEAKATELGIDPETVKKAKTNAALQTLIDNPPVKESAPAQPPTPAPALDPFAGGNADPDAKV